MTLLDDAKVHLDALGAANRAFMQTYPGDRAARQPVHTVYGGAQLFKAETAVAPRRSRARHDGHLRPRRRPTSPAASASPATTTAGWQRRCTSASAASSNASRSRTSASTSRMATAPAPDAEEDATAITAAREVARGMRRGHAAAVHRHPHQVARRGAGRRAARARSRSSSTPCSARPAAACPPTSWSRCPRSRSPSSRGRWSGCFEILERRHGLAEGTLRLELMIEMTQSIIGADGRSPLPGFLAAREGRCVAAHFGTYDYTASCNVTAAFQVMDHPCVRPGQGQHAAGPTPAPASSSPTDRPTCCRSRRTPARR